MAAASHPVSDLLAQKIWLDPSKSGSARRRFDQLYKEHQREGDPREEHLLALTDAWTKRQLFIANANRPWAPLYWFVQFRSWYLEVHAENPGQSQKRLFVGTIELPTGQIQLWASIASKLQFYSGSGPKAKSVKLDKHKRRMIKWYEPFNEIFGFGNMPHEDPTKREGCSSAAHRLWYLSNGRWDDRQNNHIKALFYVLEAFPGLIMRRAPNQRLWWNDVQVYLGLPKFPFLGAEVDLKQLDLDQCLQAEANYAKQAKRKYHFGALNKTSKRPRKDPATSGSGENPAKPASQVQDLTNSPKISNSHKSTNKSQTNNISNDSDASNASNEADLNNNSKRQDLNTVSKNQEHGNSAETQKVSVLADKQDLGGSDRRGPPAESPLETSSGNRNDHDSLRPIQGHDLGGAWKMVRYRRLDQDGGLEYVIERIWHNGDGRELWHTTLIFDMEGMKQNEDQEQASQDLVSG